MKHKNVARFIAVLSVAALLLFIPACSRAGTGENGGNADSIEDAAGPKEAGGKAPERFVPKLPDADLGGYEFRALVFEYGTSTVAFDAEEETGDLINDAIYKRNRYVEEKYNVALKQIKTQNTPWDANDSFKRSVMSGADDFDVCSQVDFKAFELVAEGLVLSADRLPYIDLAQPWYMRDINEASSVQNKTYIAFGDECLSLYENISVLCFNKKLMQDLGFENLYNLVRDGRWTYDKFFEMCGEAALDIDGNGKMDASDRYGIVSQNDAFLPLFWICAGIQTVVKDSEDMLALNLAGNEKLFGLLEKTCQMLYGGKKIYFDSFEELGYTEENRNVSRRQFENDLGLFYAAGIGGVPALRAMETDFGIVPFPKADESQDRYYARMANPWPKIVPVHAPDPERTSMILEAVAAESGNAVIPVLKELCLKTKFTRDDESVEMVDLIFGSVFIDLGDSMYWDVRSAVTSEMMGKGNFASMAEKQSAKLQKILDNFNELIANMGE